MVTLFSPSYYGDEQNPLWFDLSNNLALVQVWNLYGLGRLCEAVDPTLEGRFQEEEASRVLQIGLLCTQASAELRPSMSMVVKMLSDNQDIPQPTQPPFLNSNNVIPPGTDNSRPASYTQSSDPRATEAALICGNSFAALPDRRTFIANFLMAMDSLTPQIASQRFASTVNGTGNNTVYAFGECMRDLSQKDCNLCFAQCKTQILRCLPFQRANRVGRLFFDGCYLRYDDYEFFKEALSAEDRTVCGNSTFGGNRTTFRPNTIELVRNLSAEAQKNNGFFVGSVNRGNSTVFGLAQCWKLVNGSSCGKCLENAVSMIGSCLPKEEGRVLNTGCYLRYSTHRFYNNSEGDTPGGGGGRRHLVIILAVSSSALAVVLTIATAIFFGKRELARRARERKQLGVLLATVNKSELNFSYETLERATNYFHASNKLGQGGSGSVYKGILPGGNVVAIKRLFFNTRQWVDHFFNEVNLISDVHHKNLVKLLGFSITDRENTRLLSWEVWNLHGLGRLCEAVDPTLEGRFQEEEASRVLQIGLLCTQASAELRPSMSMVVKMLSDNQDIPQPTQPPFLNSNNVIPPGTDNARPASYTQSSDSTENFNCLYLGSDILIVGDSFDAEVELGIVEDMVEDLVEV
ncbi:hypothetical protein HHK36_024976 [Tetracentron sinense]|uniref:Uncharacterized protein n=1 Tax=Tetracentron sinense TaxID=13715 RepID=A0A834YP26_TETSI|nr:hypothetical protein HHK36_024976 [Tetracentron sinense]